MLEIKWRIQNFTDEEMGWALTQKVAKGGRPPFILTYLKIDSTKTFVEK